MGYRSKYNQVRFYTILNLFIVTLSISGCRGTTQLQEQHNVLQDNNTSIVCDTENSEDNSNIISNEKDQLISNILYQIYNATNTDANSLDCAVPFYHEDNDHKYHGINASFLLDNNVEQGDIIKYCVIDPNGNEIKTDSIVVCYDYTEVIDYVNDIKSLEICGVSLYSSRYTKEKVDYIYHLMIQQSHNINGFIESVEIVGHIDNMDEYSLHR